MSRGHYPLNEKVDHHQKVHEKQKGKDRKSQGHTPLKMEIDHHQAQKRKQKERKKKWAPTRSEGR